MTFFGFAGGISPNSLTLSICMFGMGLAYGILIDALMTLASEQVGPKYRIVQTLSFQWTLSMQVSIYYFIVLFGTSTNEYYQKYFFYFFCF